MDDETADGIREIQRRTKDTSKVLVAKEAFENAGGDVTNAIDALVAQGWSRRAAEEFINAIIDESKE